MHLGSNIKGALVYGRGGFSARGDVWGASWAWVAVFPLPASRKVRVVSWDAMSAEFLDDIWTNKSGPVNWPEDSFELDPLTDAARISSSALKSYSADKDGQAVKMVGFAFSYDQTRKNSLAQPWAWRLWLAWREDLGPGQRPLIVPYPKPFDEHVQMARWVKSSVANDALNGFWKEHGAPHFWVKQGPVQQHGRPWEDSRHPPRHPFLGHRRSD